MPDQGQKSEKPTQRRLVKAREEGNFPTARLFVNAVQFLAFVSLLHSWGPGWFQQFQTSFDGLLQRALNPRMNPMDLTYLGVALLKQSMIPVALLGSSLIMVTFSIQLVVTGFGISLKKLTPDLKRLDPLTKLKQLPRQNLPALLQAAIMLPVFAVVIYYLVAGDLDSYVALPLQSLRPATTRVFGFIETLLWKASLLFVAFGAVDLLRQKSRYQRDLRMSKQEIRDEVKETDGNPLIKQRIRRLRRDLARRNMMRAVPTATALIVNPTHYAVALKYDMETRGAPKVVAKGKNYLAGRIRQKALENQVPLIENPPLAQGLYKHVDVGQEIPAHFYKAVAEVLAYIFRVMNGRRTA
jgi:flagellar biosynthetic protein FlhB